MIRFFFGAQDKSRTCTGVLPLPPQSSVSTNSTTWALLRRQKYTFFDTANQFFKKKYFFQKIIVYLQP